MPKNQPNWLTKALTNHSSFKAFLEPVAQLIQPNWQATGYGATVIQNRTESDLVFTLVLKPNRKWPNFKAGQHLEIQVEINGTRYSRTFSLSCAPSYYQQTGLVELTIRKQEYGKVTPFLSEHIKTGDQLTLSPPRGTFTLPEHHFPLLLLAGGSGITPFRSFLQQLSLTRPDQDVHLLYYNQATEPLFAVEWPLLQKIMPKLKVTHIDTAEHGLINAQQLQQVCPDAADRTAYLCGPYGLITTSRDLLLQQGLSDEDIHHELFGPKPLNKLSFDTAADVHFSHTQITHTTEAGHPKSLLEVAEAAHVNPASGCRMGVCHQCKCRKKQGVVYNTLTEKFSDTGEEDIQLCVSIAASDVTLEL